MREFQTTVSLGTELESVNVNDYVFEQGELDFENFRNFLEKKTGLEDPLDHSITGIFAESVTNGLKEAYLNGQEVTLSSIISGMNEVCDSIESNSPDKILSVLRLSRRIPTCVLTLISDRGSLSAEVSTELERSGNMFQAREIFEKLDKILKQAGI